VPTLVVCAIGCGGPRSADEADAARAPALVRLEHGRLVDVYGLAATGEGALVELFRQDVMVGGDVQDQRPSNSTLRDEDVTYDFLANDPDTLQPRLLIPRPVDSAAFRAAFDALDDHLPAIAPQLADGAPAATPFDVVPRNAGIVFDRPIGVTDDFFVARDADGRVVGLRNTEAVQLLQRAGAAGQATAYAPLPVRIVVGESHLVLDPVLLGREGAQYQTTNNAAGLPASPDSVGANLRIALALDGPLALPRLRAGRAELLGTNNGGRQAIVRDFRAGNQADNSATMVNGFVRDDLPLRVVGEIPFLLEQVDTINAQTQEITVYKHGIAHEIDRGDVFRIVVDGTGAVFGAAEVVADPIDDAGAPATQHVRVRIRRIPGLEGQDPRRLPGYPATPAEREPWLVANAPRAICVAEFTAGDADGRDDPRNFLRFSPAPLPLGGAQPAPNEFVSPFAGVIVRFNKPVDLASVRWADTFFLAMRDLTDAAGIADFVASRPNAAGGFGMHPASFDVAKYRTPYLVAARVFDEDGSQTTLRLQPSSGMFLGGAMRDPANPADLRYFLHLVAASADGGVRDLAGNALDLQGTTSARSNGLVVPFTLDTRMNAGLPVFPDNIAVSVVRRMASPDEDAMPSYFLPDEVRAPDQGNLAQGRPLDDLFGAFVHADGRLLARPTTRVRLVADNVNQTPAVQNTVPGNLLNPLAWCPQSVSGQRQVASNAPNSILGVGIQNPHNPFGCRLQTLWREIDLSLSRTDPFDFNLDVEGMFWAPHTASEITYDQLDRVSLTLGHAEYRPAPCVGEFSALASLPDSGLRSAFERNFLWNPTPVGGGTEIASQAQRRVAYADATLTIDPAAIVLERNQVNRYLPLPTFQKPYFVFRDETVAEQGGDAGRPSDRSAAIFAPYLASPFAMGQGRRWIDRAGAAQFVQPYWNDATNVSLTSGPDAFTGGLLGSVALPLLADFWTYCDSSALPSGAGFVALGTNGWQVALTVQSGPTPLWRVFSAGRPAVGGAPPVCRGPGDPEWSNAAGGFLVGATTPTPNGDNSFYWVMLDVVKRQSVVTSGFLDLYDPHRVPAGFDDPRLGPFYLAGGNPTPPTGVLPRFAWQFDPPLASLPPGSSLLPQFRGAGAVDPQPWYWRDWIEPAVGNAVYPAAMFDAGMREQMRPTARNFPLDPHKAGDAHIRKWDQRPLPGQTTARNWWTHLYNRTVTSYVEDPNTLMSPAFTAQFAGPNETFLPTAVRYVNWRFVVSNDVDADPPAAPSIDTFALAYRFAGP
jgi:hypothetical protein